MLLPHIKKHFGFYALVFIVFILAIINYQPGTFLTGWDTLHPEFDFGLNFKRLFFGVWRSDQGLGAVAGHSHMSDLPRVIILWILHFVLPVSFLRYTYVFLCLLFGPLGIYFLIHYLLKKVDNDPAKGGMTNKNEPIAFLGGLFFLFNLGTVQQFIVAFEMFTTQYAVLPWIVLFSLKYLQNPNRKNLLYFAIATLFSTPQAYAAHLWYAFFAVYICFLFLHAFFQRRIINDTGVVANAPSQNDSKFNSNTQIKKLKNIILLVFVTLLINSYWLLPNLYFVKTSSHVPVEAKQTRLFSQEYGLRNREHGYLKDVALIKGFYFNWSIFNFDKEKPEYLMSEWRKHFSNPLVTYIGYGLFTTVVLAFLASALHRQKLFLVFSPFLLIPMIFLLNNTYPFSLLFDFLIQFSIFDQAFRFVFTKFSIFLSFAYTIYFSYFIFLLFNRWSGRTAVAAITFISFLFLFIYATPAFKGNLISSKIKIKIPGEYFRFWDFMKNQTDGAVLSLPLHTFSGWQYYDWKYQGSGFIWFGLKQAILDRDFDRWSIQNEQAYREFHHALYTRNPDFFLTNLKKFNVQYILWDRNNITTSLKNRPQKVYDRESGLLLSQLESQLQISRLAQFANLTVYKVNTVASDKLLTLNLPLVNPQYRWSDFDFAYQKLGPYFTSLDQTDSARSGYVFPYRDIYTPDDKLKQDIFNKFSYLQENQFLLNFSAEEIYESNKSVDGVTLTESAGEKILNFNAKNTINGVGLDFYSLSHDKAYLLVINARHIQGLPLRICLKNLYSTLCDIYDEIYKNRDFGDNYFFIPPSEVGIGYELTIDNLSYGDIESVNDLKFISIIPVSSKLMGSYEKIDAASEYITTLKQAYNPGWIAILDGKILEHVLVNNWANGWRLSDEVNSDTGFVFIFWPQYLQYFGFALLIGSFVWILKRKNQF